MYDSSLISIDFQHVNVVTHMPQYTHTTHTMDAATCLQFITTETLSNTQYHKRIWENENVTFINFLGRRQEMKRIKGLAYGCCD